MSDTCLDCFCGLTYSNIADLKEHRIARGHFPSHRCRDQCAHPSATPDDGSIRRCGFCRKVCDRLDILEDHRIFARHYSCPDCDLAFETLEVLQNHRKSVLHSSEFECCDCKVLFKNLDALDKHTCRTRLKVRSQNSKKAEAAKPEFTCNKCPRKFRSAQALEQHRQSLKHKPLSNLGCPMGKGCKGKFSSPSALMHHLEGGKCQSGIDRNELYLIVQACDEAGIIHDGPTLPPSISSAPLDRASLIGSDVSIISALSSSEWSLMNTPSGSVVDSEDQWQSLEDSQVSLSRRFSIDSVIEPSLNCPLCPPTRRGFATLLGLRQHMESPAHSPKLYHCPSESLGDSALVMKGHATERNFSTLSGLAQHLESGACRGGKKGFLQCIDIVHRRLEEFGFSKMPALLTNKEDF